MHILDSGDAGRFTPPYPLVPMMATSSQPSSRLERQAAAYQTPLGEVGLELHGLVGGDVDDDLLAQSAPLDLDRVSAGLNVERDTLPVRHLALQVAVHQDADEVHRPVHRRG